MTERVKGLFVALKDDIREDDIQILVGAIMQFRNVLNVELNLATSSDCMNEWVIKQRVKNEVWANLNEVLK